MGCVAVLAYLLAIVHWGLDWWPHEHLRLALEYAQASHLQDQRPTDSSAWEAWEQGRGAMPEGGHFPGFQYLWAKVDASKEGVVLSDAARYQDGYTLLTLNHAQALLVDVRGNTVHRWQMPFEKAFPASHLPYPPREEKMDWGGAYLFPNGDLLAVYAFEGESPAGAGLVKLDKDSRLIWSYADHIHHVVDVDEEGHIYALSAVINATDNHGLPEVKLPVIEEFVLKLDAQGRLLKKVSLLEAFKNSPYREMLAFSAYGRDVTHVNSVRRVSEASAARFPFSKPGDLLISMRAISAIALLNLEEEAIVWAATGPWREQHYPELLDNGHILLFDNNGGTAPGSRSRLIEWEPQTGAIGWLYEGSLAEPLEVDVWGMQQRLPNGNTLVVHSTQGRIFEITGDGQIVWDYYNPMRAGSQREYISLVRFAWRYLPAALPFLTQEEP